MRYTDEQIRELAAEVVAGHQQDTGGRCLTCRTFQCGAFRLAEAVLAVDAQAGPNTLANARGPADVCDE